MNLNFGQLLSKTFIHLSIILFLTLSCKKKQEDSTTQVDDKPTILNSLSQDDSRINNIDMPEISQWKPNTLSIQFMGSETVDGPLHFAFSLPMVHEDSLDDGIIPKIVFEPEIKGRFSWKSPTNLLFQPNEGELNHGQYFTIYIDTARPLQGNAYALQEPWIEEYHVPFFTMAGKVASWRVTKGYPQFISILNWRSGEIGNGPIYLLYDQPIDVEKAGKNIDIHDEEENALQFNIFRPDNIDMVYDGEVNLEHIVGVQIKNLPGNNDTEESPGVIVNVPSWYNDGTMDTEHRFLTVRTDFDLKNAYVNYQWNNYEYVPLYSSWNLTFSNWVSLGQIKKHVHIEPKPKSIHYSSSSDYDYSDEKYISVNTLSMEFEPGTTYTLNMDENLTDVLGNKLPQEFDTVFTTVDLKPILELPREAILIEKEVTKIPVRTQNLSQIEAKIFPFKSEQQFAKALLMGDRNDLSDYGLYGSGENVDIANKNSSTNNVELLDVNLNRKGGLYGVVVNAVGTGSEGGDILSDVVLVQSSNLGITSKVYEEGIFTWITSLNDATPVGNKTVKLFDGDKVIAETTTNQNGVAVFNTSKILQRGTLQKTLIIIAGEGKNASVAKIDRKELSNAWQFGLHGKVRSYNPLHAVVFTERGVYRPSEVVHIKAILSEQAGKSAMAKIKVNDPRGQQVLNKTKDLDDFNSTSIDFKLKEQAAVGEYSVHVSVSGGAYTTRTFKVEEYRVPTFEVKVKTDDNKWEINKTIKATIEAKYLHGGTLDGREIRWMVSRTPVPFTAKDFPQYVFSWNQGMNYEGIVTSGNKRLDGKGKLNVRFNPNHPPLAGAMQYTLEGTVTDVDRQAYAGRTSKVIHPADFYIGVKPPSRSILSTGEKLKVPVIALDVSNKVVNGAKVKVLLERIDYHTAARLSSGGNVQMLNRPETVRINYYEIKTKPTASILEFDLKEAGRYRINAWTEDKNKKLVQSGFEFTVSGNNATAWPRFDQEQIDLIADKESYEAGETAKIITQ
ncbi:MAG: MG2 domain-containing protein, partial [Bacteroidales bacterium]|nr:MG2 domain-containing protein [Bacteroidales bacterium]